MASLEIHKAHIKEHSQAINEAIAVGLERRPATLGLHASACSISLIEMYLHLLGKISTGMTIKHEWFKGPKPEQKMTPLAERKIGADFPDKEQILSLMYTIEEHRNKLIYGKPTPSAVEAVYKAYDKIYRLISERMKEAGEEIE